MTDDRVLFQFPIESIGFAPSSLSTQRGRVESARRRLKRTPKELPLYQKEQLLLRQAVLAMVTTGERLLAIRDFLHLSQAAAARAIGISQRSLSDLEMNKYSPSVVILLAIDSAFRVTPNEMLGIAR